MPTCSGFNPRPRAGASLRDVRRGGREGVSIHAPARGRASSPPREFRPARFQSTPPRGGEPGHPPARFYWQQVSIHAPARGRADTSERGIFLWRSFNPRPRAGASVTSLLPRSDSVMFQSTPPRGGEQEGPDIRLHGLGVSIHAPARGRAPLMPELATTGSLFQSTPPRGGEQRAASLHCPNKCFNPRPRAGASGSYCGDDSGGELVSIHAPARGRAHVVGRLLVGDRGFNPRPRAGASG